MSKQFEEAPPLPRQPTALNVPRAMGTVPPDDQTITTLPVDAHTLPPPPKFPSLTDVSLPSATAAAEAASQTIPPSSTIDTTTTTSPTTSTSEQPAPSPPAPVTSQVADDIAAVLERNSIVPGSAHQQALQLGQQIWTQSDQDELDQLLAKGRDVYVPPEVTVDEISARESYVLLPPTKESVEPETTPEESKPSYRNWSYLKQADKTEGSTVIAPVPSPSTDVEEVSSRAVEEEKGTREVVAQTDKPAGPPDVSNTIFGMRFTTVPVTCRKPVTTTQVVPAETTDVVQHTATDVELKTDGSAHINVTDDYGLKGGHTSGVNDAAFLKDGTLVTCGDDGKVCIWDMDDRVVEREFVPYEGEGVTMVYPMPDEDEDVMKTLMTFSKGRVMRIWAVDDKQAVLLRTSPIKQSDKALYMSVPHISKEVKAKAAAAAAAAAVTTTDAPEIPAQVGSTSVGATEATTKVPETAPEAAPEKAPEAAPEASPEPVAEDTNEEEVEEEKEKKRFSFTKVLSFGRSAAGRKAVAS